MTTASVIGAGTISGVTLLNHLRKGFTMTTTTHLTKPTWDETWAQIGSEDMLAAKALIELSPALRRDAEQYLSRPQYPAYASDRWDAELVGYRPGESEFDWEAWLTSYDEHGRGWSTTEHHLFALAASLLDADRPLRLRAVLGHLGSWEAEVWPILVDWGTGGNNREYAGRSTVVPSRPTER